MYHLSSSKVFSLAVLLGLASGCTTMRAPSPADPYEGFNRGVSQFNDVIDKMALKPLAKGYDAIVPNEIQTCVGNFFSNLNDLGTAVNNLLQAKPKAAGQDICRFALNSTIGILGLVDVASPLGLPKHDEDFGQTLGYWGVGAGPYVVLPFLGPSTVRDTVGRVGDSPFDPLTQHRPVDERNTAIFIKAVDKRASLLPTTDLVDRIALDKYSFIRDAYLARRASQIRDGALGPDEEPEDDSGGAASPSSQLNDSIGPKAVGVDPSASIATNDSTTLLNGIPQDLTLGEHAQSRFPAVKAKGD
jgi:phospholipid-binding lipoprotein MlaA